MELSVREPVVLVKDFAAAVEWYRDVLGLEVKQLFDDHIHYANLENERGVRVGIADAAEMGVEPVDRAQNTVVLQFEVPDVAAFFAHLEVKGGKIVFGPSHDEKDDFWFGAFTDPEGNPCWVVDTNCP